MNGSTMPICVLALDFAQRSVDEVKSITTILDRSGYGNNGSACPPTVLSDCEDTANWTGTSLSTDTSEKVEGEGSLRDAVASPTAYTDYNIDFNPTTAINLPSSKYLSLWLRSSRASDDFDFARIFIYDTSGNWRYWDITFAANTWTKQKVLLSTGDGESATPPDLSSIDYIRVLVNTGSDTTPFTRWVDYLAVVDEPTFVSSVYGTVMDFDGVDDYVNCGHDASFDTVTDELTIEAWVKRGGATGSEQSILAKYGHPPPQGGCSYDLGFREDDKIYLDVGGDYGASADHRRYYYTSNTFTDTDVWYHIVATIKASTDDVHIYVNGVEEPGSKAFYGTPSIYVSTSNVCLGKREVPTSPHYFKGQIAGARVYNGVITAEMVREWYRQGILPVQVTHASTWMVGIALMLLVWGVLVKAVKKAFA